MIDLFNIERLPVTLEDLTEDTYNPEFIIALNKSLNIQADRIEKMLKHIAETNPNPIGYADIMHWKSRLAYLRNVGQAKRAHELEKAQALKEAKEADDDTEFIEGYKEFLATEFNVED